MSLHEKLPHSFTLDDLAASFWATYPDSDKNIYGALFDQLYKAEITPDVGLNILNQTIIRKKSLKLSELAFQVGQGFKTEQDLTEFWKQWGSVDRVATTLPEVDNDLEQLLSNHVYDQGLRWRLDCLNKSFGNCRG